MNQDYFFTQTFILSSLLTSSNAMQLWSEHVIKSVDTPMWQSDFQRTIAQENEYSSGW
jgi:hypothetical protein